MFSLGVFDLKRESLLWKGCMLVDALRPDGIVKAQTVAFVSFFRAVTVRRGRAAFCS